MCRLVLLLIISPVFILLTGCYSPLDHPELGQKLSGTWQHNRSGATLEILPDGRFTHTIPQGNSDSLNGVLTRGMDRLRFTYDTGVGLCNNQPGLYLFHREGNVLVLSILEDPCAARRNHLVDTWSLVSE